MPKQPDTPQHRFRIWCETEVAEMGPVIAQLTIMGFRNVGFELIEDVNTFKQNGHREKSGPELAREWLADHPSFQTKELVEFFENDGRAASAAYSALKKLQADGLVVKAAPMMYRRADVQAIASPAKEEPVKASAERARTPRIKGQPNGQLILLMFARNHGGKINTAEAKDVFATAERPKDSVHPTINHLLGTKRLKRLGDAGSGAYEMTAKGTREVDAWLKATGQTAEEKAHHG